MSDPLSPASLMVPEVQLWLAKYVAAATRYNDAQDFGASPETWPSLEQAEKEAESALLLAVRDATLKAERERLLALTPPEVVEEARTAIGTARMCDSSETDDGHDYFRCAECARIGIRAALPVLLAPEVARREQVERELSLVLQSPNEHLRAAADLATRLGAAEAERGRLKAALEKTRPFLAEYAKEVPPCDHAVGICLCGVHSDLAFIANAIKEAER